MICVQCRTPFELWPRRGGPVPKYCSPRCRYASRRCRTQGCVSRIRRDGLCFRHYRKMLRTQKAWTMRDEILDFFELEGWATASELAYRFGRNVEAVERVLRKLRAEGLLRSRFVELAFANGKERLEGRTEWRAV